MQEQLSPFQPIVCSVLSNDPRQKRILELQAEIAEGTYWIAAEELAAKLMQSMLLSH